MVTVSFQGIVSLLCYAVYNCYPCVRSVQKSTTAANIGAELARQGKYVLLVDTDRQGTSSNWISDRNQNSDLPKIHSIQKFDNIHETFSDLAKRYEYVVDSAGRDSRELRTGMSAADVLIVPFRPWQPDLDTLPALQDIITMALDLNPKIQVKAWLTMAPTNPVVKETQDAKIYLADYPVLNLMQTILRDRKIYRDCMSEGKGAVEMDNAKARSEIHCLVQEIVKW